MQHNLTSKYFTLSVKTLCPNKVTFTISRDLRSVSSEGCIFSPAPQVCTMKGDGTPQLSAVWWEQEDADIIPLLVSWPFPLTLLPPPRWMVTSWSACTRSCGGGVQTRRVTCQKLKASGISTPMSNDMCTQLAKRPVDTQACNQQLCVEWAFSSWGQVRELF